MTSKEIEPMLGFALAAILITSIFVTMAPAGSANGNTPPASITNLQNVTGATWINWTWTNPADADFNYTMVFLNGTWEINTSEPFFNATALDPETSYELSTHTVDEEGNVNRTWVNQTTTTLPLPDTSPPASITNLQNVTGATWINWTWTNPADADFNYTMVFLNGMWETNTSEPFFNATALDPETSYEIGTHTVDEEGNVNKKWVNQTARTKARPDTSAPETEITAGPSGAIAYNDVTFTWTGSDDGTDTPDLRYRYTLDGITWSAWTSETSVTYNDLSNGAYTFMVKALDEAENEDLTPATRSFTVSVTIRGGGGGGGGGRPSIDSDGDGYFDAVERLMGTNPNDPNDYPNKQEAATPTTTTTPPQTTKPTQTPTLPSTLTLTVPQPVATPTSAPASATPVPKKLGFSRELAFEELVASIIVLAAIWLLVIAYLVLKME